jgi:hypothetical protein
MMGMREAASTSWFLRALGCGGIIVIACWGFALLLTAFMGPLKVLGQSKGCQSNLHSMTRAFQMYADDYEDHYPLAASWMDSTKPYVDNKDRYQCPSVSQEMDGRFGYAINAELAAKERRKIADLNKAALVFDSSILSRNASGSVQTLPKPGRHRSRPTKGQAIRPGNNVGYADGGVRMRFDDK